MSARKSPNLKALRWGGRDGALDTTFNHMARDWKKKRLQLATEASYWLNDYCKCQKSRQFQIVIGAATEKLLESKHGNWNNEKTEILMSSF